MISATLFSDPACPWAYSESPALRVLEWRYGDQLDWRLVLIGLTETASQYEERGYTPLRGALGQVSFRRYGMPFTPNPKDRVSATARACRAVVAARLLNPGSEWDTFRALQLANFNSRLLLDDDEQLREVLRPVDGIDADRVYSMLDSPEVTEAYRSNRAETREAEGSAAELQGKTSTSDGPVRFTAPSLVLQSNGTRLVAGGFQPVEAYDVLIANIDPTLHRELPPETPSRCSSASRRAHHPGGSAVADPEQRSTGPPRGRGRDGRARRLGQGRARVGRRRRALEARRARP